MRHLMIVSILFVAGCMQVDVAEHQARPRRCIDESKVLDLTYPFDERSIYWPTAKKFELEQVSFGRNDAGQWYAANNYCASEHGGTHLDAPIHFAEGRPTAADIPVTRLMGPARVIDIRKDPPPARPRGCALSWLAMSIRRPGSPGVRSPW